MKSTIIVHPPQEVIFPMALELYFNLEAGRGADGIKVKCWELAIPSSPARTREQPLKLPSLFCSCHGESTSTKWYFQTLPTELLWISKARPKAGLPTRWSAFIAEVNSSSRKKKVFTVVWTKTTAECMKLLLLSLLSSTGSVGRKLPLITK